MKESDDKKQGQEFGGRWTEDKLSILGKYLDAYTTALKFQDYTLIYIDAFAGAGWIQLRQKKTRGPSFWPEEPAKFVEGSTRKALSIRHPFDEYRFVELAPRKCKLLHKLKTEFPSLADRINIIPGDANDFCRSLEGEDWSEQRAVMFVDPKGMQFRWRSLEAIAGTEAIDLWILIPLSIGPNRIMRKNGIISRQGQVLLDEFWGTPTWRERLYGTRVTRGFFETIRETTRADLGQMREFMMERLKTIFVDVAQPKILYNSKGSPLFMFCFCVSNPYGKARQRAMTIATDILKKLEPWRT